MALYHKWDVKNDFAYVLQLFSLISDSLGCVGFLVSWLLGQKTGQKKGKIKLQTMDQRHILNYFFSGRLRKLYIEENPVQGVETILDIGTGTGGSAFVLGQLFPEVHR